MPKQQNRVCIKPASKKKRIQDAAHSLLSQMRQKAFDEFEIYEAIKTKLPFPIRADLIIHNLKTDSRFDFEHIRGIGFMVCLYDSNLNGIQRAHAKIHCLARSMERLGLLKVAA